MRARFRWLLYKRIQKQKQKKKKIYRKTLSLLVCITCVARRRRCVASLPSIYIFPPFFSCLVFLLMLLYIPSVCVWAWRRRSNAGRRASNSPHIRNHPLLLLLYSFFCRWTPVTQKTRFRWHGRHQTPERSSSSSTLFWLFFFFFFLDEINWVERFCR